MNTIKLLNRIVLSIGFCLFLTSNIYAQSLKEKAESGDKVAQFQYARALTNRHPKEEDYQKAFVWLKKSAEQGYASAQCDLGYCYWAGQGIAKDYKQAAYWYKKSAEQGNENAQYNLGVCYSNGHGVPKSDYTAFTWYKKSAQQGYKIAEYTVGKAYYHGKGTTVNYQLAVEWFHKAALQKHSGAMYYLGQCYTYGYGVTKDMAKAVEWYEKSADDSNTDAEYTLALLYLEGNGVEKDSITAADWLLHSAGGGWCGPHQLFSVDRATSNQKAIKKLLELSKLNNSLNLHYFLAILGCYYFAIDDYWNAEKNFRRAIEENSALGIIELGIMYYYIWVNQPHEGELDSSTPWKDKRLGDFMNIESWRHSDNRSVIDYLKEKKWADNDNVIYWMEEAIDYGYGSFSYGANCFSIYDHILFLLNDSISGYGNRDKALDISYKCLMDTTASGYEGALSTISLSGRSNVTEKEINMISRIREFYVKTDNLEAYKKKFVLQVVNSGLGYCYYKGIGVERNYKKAFSFLLEGAELGDGDAMRLLAACYRYGRGTQINKSKDKEWTTKAAKCGDERAKKLAEIRAN